jgi:hypothetical protein
MMNASPSTQYTTILLSMYVVLLFMSRILTNAEEPESRFRTPSARSEPCNIRVI